MAVALVIVSHSRRLAEGVVELASQMAQGNVPIVAVGGTEDSSLGTSMEKILQALQQLNTADGILVLLDLGSAVMATEMAIEMLGEEERKRIVISDAPLVEGAVVAAVEASAGSSLQEVADAAMTGHDMPKRSNA